MAMHGLAARRQKQDALLRVFFMFVAMTLLLVRVGLAARGRPHPLAAHAEAECDALAVLRSPNETELSDLYAAAVALLLAAEAAVEQMLGMAQELYERLAQTQRFARSAMSQASTRRMRAVTSRQPIDSS